MDNIIYADFYGVPITTYAMIGITTFALAYFTITDKDTNTTTEIKPNTPQEPQQEIKEPQEQKENEEPNQTAEQTGGKGKNRRNKSNKKKK